MSQIPISVLNSEDEPFRAPEGVKLTKVEGELQTVDITSVVSVASNTFTFRETGGTPGRVLEQSVVIRVPSGAGSFICTPYFTGAFITRDGFLTERPLGQFFVSTFLRGDNLVCRVRLTDSNQDDPIFIQVTATVVFYR